MSLIRPSRGVAISYCTALTRDRKMRPHIARCTLVGCIGSTIQCHLSYLSLTRLSRLLGGKALHP